MKLAVLGKWPAPAVLAAIRSPVAVSLVVLSAVLIAAGCGGEAAGVEPVSWSVARKVIRAQVGSYDKTISVETEGQRQTMMREWVVFDHRRKFIDRRIGLGDDPSTATIEKRGTKAAPNLRFIYSAKRILMWNPSVAQTCGTPWVEMPAESITRLTGFRLGDLSILEPAAIIAHARGEPKVVENNERMTLYQVPVMGTAGLSVPAIARRNPELIPELKRQTVFALVRIPRHGGLIKIVVDPNPALAAVYGDELDEVRLTVTWTLGRSRARIDRRLPANVARSSCLS